MCINLFLDNGEDCLLFGLVIEIRNCNIFLCLINGNYLLWFNFSLCSKSCGNGMMERMRNCLNLELKYGGMNCFYLGFLKEVKSCNVFFCLIHGNFFFWLFFSVCSKSCGNGKKIRIRLCLNFVLKYGGKNCFVFEFLKEVCSCNIFFCFVYGNYLFWLNFSSCFKSCGNGKMV